MDDKLIRELQEIKIVKKLQEDNETFLQDMTGHPIARVIDSESEIRIYDMTGHPLGKYDKMSDLTTDACGRYISHGNTTGMLIR
jgi:hypothetical protein